MVDIPTREPENFNAGDTVSWKKSLSDYKASDGWVLKYAARGAGSINLTASADGDDHLTSISAATSSTYTAGTYKWLAYVEKAGERYTVGEGYWDIKVNLATATSITDRLITLQTDIDAINAFLGRNYNYASYSIAGRSLNNHSITDLFTLRDRLQAELNRLRDEEKINRGVPTRQLIRVRINNT
jgi:hypothetical protein